MKVTFEDTKKSIAQPLALIGALSWNDPYGGAGSPVYGDGSDGYGYGSDGYGYARPVHGDGHSTVLELFDADRAFEMEMQKWGDVRHLVKTRVQDPMTQFVVDNYLNLQARDSAYQKAILCGSSPAVKTLVEAKRMFRDQMDASAGVQQVLNQSCDNPDVKLAISNYINDMDRSMANDKCRRYIKAQQYNSPFNTTY